MKSILQQLYDGEIAPGDQFKPYLKEYRENWEQIGTTVIEFTKKLTKEQETEFNDLMNKHLSFMPVEMAQVFSDGFKLGVRIMCEVFSTEDMERLNDFQNGGKSADEN